MYPASAMKLSLQMGHFSEKSIVLKHACNQLLAFSFRFFFCLGIPVVVVDLKYLKIG
jgi:hypothetical protein